MPVPRVVRPKLARGILCMAKETGNGAANDEPTAAPRLVGERRDLI